MTELPACFDPDKLRAQDFLRKIHFYQPPVFCQPPVCANRPFASRPFCQPTFLPAAHSYSNCPFLPPISTNRPFSPTAHL